MIRFCTLSLFLLLAFAPPGAVSGEEPVKPTPVRVGLGLTKTIELRARTEARSGKVTRKFLNSKGQLLYTYEYTLKDGMVVDIRPELPEERAESEAAVEMRAGPDPNSVRARGLEVGSAVYSVVGDDGKKEAFRIETFRSLSLLSGRTLRLRMDPPRRLKQVVTANPKVMIGRVSPSDPTLAVINALAAGRTPFGLVAEDGTKETLELSVTSTEAGRNTIVVTCGEWRLWRMPEGVEIQGVINDNETIADIRPGTGSSELSITGRNPGISHMMVMGAEGKKKEECDIVVTERKRYLALNQTIRLQISPRQPIKTIEATEPKLVHVSIDSKDPNTAVLKGLEPGDTKVTLTAEDGGKDLHEFRVYSEKPGKDCLVLAQFETRTLRMTGRQPFFHLDTTDTHLLAVQQPGERPFARVTALQRGICRITFVGRELEKREVLILEPKGKELRAKDPLRVKTGEVVRWKPVNEESASRFVLDDSRIVTLESTFDNDTMTTRYTLLAQQPGKTTITFLKDDEGNRDVVEVIVSPKE